MFHCISDTRRRTRCILASISTLEVSSPSSKMGQISRVFLPKLITCMYILWHKSFNQKRDSVLQSDPHCCKATKRANKCRVFLVPKVSTTWWKSTTQTKWKNIQNAKRCPFANWKSFDCEDIRKLIKRYKKHINYSKTKPSDARNRSPSSGSGGAAPRIMLCTRITMLDPAKELRQRVRHVRFEVRLQSMYWSVTLWVSNHINCAPPTIHLTVLNEQDLQYMMPPSNGSFRAQSS